LKVVLNAKDDNTGIVTTTRLDDGRFLIFKGTVESCADTSTMVGFERSRIGRFAVLEPTPPFASLADADPAVPLKVDSKIFSSNVARNISITSSVSDRLVAEML